MLGSIRTGVKTSPGIVIFTRVENAEGEEGKRGKRGRRGRLDLGAQ